MMRRESVALFFESRDALRINSGGTRWETMRELLPSRLYFHTIKSIGEKYEKVPHCFQSVFSGLLPRGSKRQGGSDGAERTRRRF